MHYILFKEEYYFQDVTKSKLKGVIFTLYFVSLNPFPKFSPPRLRHPLLSPLNKVVALKQPLGPHLMTVEILIEVWTWRPKLIVIPGGRCGFPRRCCGGCVCWGCCQDTHHSDMRPRSASAAVGSSNAWRGIILYICQITRSSNTSYCGINRI